MGLKTPSFTMKESLVVIDEALRLIATPEQWTTGYWKCPINVKNNLGLAKYDESGRPIPKLDKRGRPVYAYCIEGAINQAVINKFGVDRALQVGALRRDILIQDEDNIENDALDNGGACSLLSVDDLVRELVLDDKNVASSLRDRVRISPRPSQVMNDRSKNYDLVMKVLRTKRDRLAAAIAAKFKA